LNRQIPKYSIIKAFTDNDESHFFSNEAWQCGKNLT